LGQGNEDVLDMLSNPRALRDLVEAAKLHPLVPWGNYHYDEEWRNGGITLKSGTTLINLDLKWNMENNTVEIFSDENFYYIQYSDIKAFHLEYETNTKTFYSTGYFSNEGLHEGFLEVVVDRPTKFISHSYLEVIPPKYNIQLDLGRKEILYRKREKFYFTRDSVLFRVKGGARNKNINYFVGEEKEIKEYVKINHLHFQSKRYLTYIVEYYNDLLEDAVVHIEPKSKQSRESQRKKGISLLVDFGMNYNHYEYDYTYGFYEELAAITSPLDRQLVTFEELHPTLERRFVTLEDFRATLDQNFTALQVSFGFQYSFKHFNTGLSFSYESLISDNQVESEFSQSTSVSFPGQTIFLLYTDSVKATLGTSLEVPQERIFFRFFVNRSFPISKSLALTPEIFISPTLVLNPDFPNEFHFAGGLGTKINIKNLYIRIDHTWVSFNPGITTDQNDWEVSDFSSKNRFFGFGIGYEFKF